MTRRVRIDGETACVEQRRGEERMLVIERAG